MHPQSIQYLGFNSYCIATTGQVGNLANDNPSWKLMFNFTDYQFVSNPPKKRAFYFAYREHEVYVLLHFVTLTAAVSTCEEMLDP